MIASLGLVACNQAVVSNQEARGSTVTTEAAPMLPSASAEGSANSSMTAQLPQVVDAATFQTILTSLNRQTGGGMRGTMTPEGLTVGKLSPDDALAALGLKEGDVITSLNGHAMSDPEHIVDATVDVMRAGRCDAQVRRGSTSIRTVVESPSWLAARTAKP